MSLFSSDHDLKIALWWPLPSSLQICNFYHVTVSKLGKCEQDDHFVNSNDYGSVVPSDINQKDDSPQSSIKWHGRNKPSSVVSSYSLATMFFSHYALPPDRCPQCHGVKRVRGSLVWWGHDCCCHPSCLFWRCYWWWIVGFDSGIVMWLLQYVIPLCCRLVKLLFRGHLLENITHY